MKILHICKVYLPVRGGVQEVIHRIIEGLKAKFEFTVLSTAEDESQRYESGVNLISAKSIVEISSMPVSLTLPSTLYKQLKKQDVVCFHYPFPLIDFLCSFFPKRANTYWIVYWHSEIVSQRFLKHLVRPFTNRMLARADKIIVSSPSLIKHSSFLTRFADKAEVIPFGLKDLPSDTITARPDRSKLLCVGRHVHYKGYDVLLNAISKIECELTIVGSGPLLEDHRALAEKLGVLDKVIFKTGLSDEEVEHQIKIADIFVLPSRLPSEAFALVQVEALRAGKPIVNTSLQSGVPWVAQNDQEALTVQPDEVESLGRAIVRLLDDDELYKRLSENARQRYLKDFTLNDFLDKTQKLYLELRE